MTECCKGKVLPISAIIGSYIEMDYLVCDKCYLPCVIKRIDANG